MASSVVPWLTSAGEDPGRNNRLTLSASGSVHICFHRGQMSMINLEGIFSELVFRFLLYMYNTGGRTGCTRAAEFS